MGYLDNILNPELSPTILHKRMLEENLKFQNEKVKQSLLDNPEHANSYLAQLSRSAMTDKVAAKLPANANFEKAILAIDPGDPRRTMLAKLQTDMPGIISGSAYGEDPRAAIMKAVQERGDAAKEDTYRYIQSKQGFFDKAPAPAAGFEEWERKNPGFTSPVSSFVFGAGSQLAAEGLKSKAVGTLPVVGRALGGLGRLLSFLPATPTPLGLGGKILAGGLMTVGGMMAADALKQGLVKSGVVELSASPLTRLAQELAIGAPGFMGVGKAAGYGIAKGAEKLAMMKSALGSTEEYAGSKAVNTFTRNAEGILRPDQPVGREDIAAVSKAMRFDEESIAARQAKMESYKTLTPEDHEAIALGKSVEEVTGARVKYNMEKEIWDNAVKDKALREEVVSHASTLRETDNLLDAPSSIALAQRRIMPNAENTIEDTAFLRKNTSIPDNVIDAMSPRMRAENRMNWEQHATEKTKQMRGHLPALREEILPPAVQAGTFKPTRVLDIKTGLPIQLGTGERLGLPASTDGVLTKTEEVVAAQKNLGMLKKRAAMVGESSSLTPIVKELAGNEKNIALGGKFTADKRIEALNYDAASLAARTHTAGSEINTAEMTTKQKYGAHNLLAVQSNDEMIQILAKHGYPDNHPRAQALIGGMQKYLKKLKLGDDAELEKMASSEMRSTIGKMMPENSPSMEELKSLAKEELSALKAEKGGKLSASDPDVESFYSKWKGVLWGGIGAAALVPISTVFGGSDAQAAPFSGRSILPSSMEALRTTNKPIEQMVAKLFEAGHGSPVLTDDAQGIKQMMRGQGYAPADVSIFPKSSIMNILDKALSPHTRGEIHFDARGVNGERLPFNPAVELGDRSQVIMANAGATLTAVKNIMKENGITGNLQEIADSTLPLVTKYHEAVNLQTPYYNARIQMLDDVMNGKFRSAGDTKATNLSKQIKLAGKDISKLDPEEQAYYQVLKDEKQKAVDSLTALQPSVEAFNAEYDVVMRQLAAKHSTTRVALAVDGTGMGPEDPWLRNMLTPNEIKAAEKIKAINDVYAVRMQETGHDIIAGPYIHHPAHPSVDYAADLKNLEKISPDGANAMRMVNFFHRTAGSKLMIPDTEYIMAKYAPDAAKRIEISDFWKMGKEGGWDQVRRQMQARGGYDGALKMLDDIRTAFDPMDTGPAGKWLNRYAAFEVARLLTLSPSVSFKHILKTMGNWAIFPAGTSIEATGQNVGLVTRQLAQATMGDTFKGKDLIADLSKAYTNQSHMYAAVSDMAPFELPQSVLDKFLMKWNQVGSAAVNGVEIWDRGQTFTSAMLMAAKKGMTPEQARYSMMDSVLKVNFLTGPNNPKWLKDPLIRTMMMFQGTPFKILEQRAMLSYQAGKDVTNTLKLLNQMRKDVKAGEANFKWHMLKDELTKSKDVYGTPYSQQFLKQMMVIGSVVATGKMAFDSNLWGHVMHIPGTKMNDKGVELGLNPVVGAAYKTAMSAGKEGEDEFWMSRFWNNWLGQTGFPAIAHKISRLRDEDIPAMYKDGKLSYLFGVPRRKE